MNAIIYINGEESYTLKIKKSYTIYDIKVLLKTIPNIQNYDIKFFMNSTDLLNVFDNDEYDNLKLKKIWNNLQNPVFFLDTKDISKSKIQTPQTIQNISKSKIQTTQRTNQPQNISKSNLQMQIKTGYLTGIKDLDRKILNNLSDADFLQCCSLNKTISNKVCDETYFRIRTELKYPYTIEYKNSNSIWKTHYLNIVKYIDLLKKDFQYLYNDKDRNPEFVYKIKLAVPPYKKPKTVDDLFFWIISTGDLNLVKYLISKEEIPNKEKAILLAKQLLYTDIVNYLQSL